MYIGSLIIASEELSLASSNHTTPCNESMQKKRSDQPRPTLPRTGSNTREMLVKANKL